MLSKILKRLGLSKGKKPKSTPKTNQSAPLPPPRPGSAKPPLPGAIPSPPAGVRPHGDKAIAAPTASSAVRPTATPQPKPATSVSPAQPKPAPPERPSTQSPSRPKPKRQTPSVKPVKLSELAGGADRFAIIDCETSGLFDSHRIVEIAILTMELDGSITERWHTLLNPVGSAGISYLHKAYPYQLMHAPEFQDVAADIAIRLDGACLVAHNLDFDLGFIHNEFMRINQPIELNDGICTLETHRSCRKISRSNLKDACEEFGVQLNNAHSASGDAEATAELFVKMKQFALPGEPSSFSSSFSLANQVFHRGMLLPQLQPLPKHLEPSIEKPHLKPCFIDLEPYRRVVAETMSAPVKNASSAQRLFSIAAQMGLTPEQALQAHRQFLNQQIDRHLKGTAFSEDLLEDLLCLAEELQVDHKLVHRRTIHRRIKNSTVSLHAGDRIAITSNLEKQTAKALKAWAEDMSLDLRNGVTKDTKLLIDVDQFSFTANARKARIYGVGIASGSEVLANLGTTNEIPCAVANMVHIEAVTCSGCGEITALRRNAKRPAKYRCTNCKKAAKNN